MKLLFFVSIILGLSFNVSAQYNNHSLVSTAGDYFEAENISISWSIGEIATETLSGSNVILTQGFQQSLLTPTGIEENSIIIDASFIIYPNPAVNQINIKLYEYGSSNSYPNQYSMYNTQGKILLSEEISSSLTIVDLQNLQEGVYFLHLLNVNSNFNETVVIQKMN